MDLYNVKYSYNIKIISSCTVIPFIVAGELVLLSMCWEIKVFYIRTWCFLYYELSIFFS